MSFIKCFPAQVLVHMKCPLFLFCEIVGSWTILKLEDLTELTSLFM